MDTPKIRRQTGHTEPLDAPRPIEASDSVFTEELTWMEVRDAVASGKTTLIVATGGLEPNGPFVALGKHNYVLRATTEAIARRLGNALVAPIVPFVPEGDIKEKTRSMRYPGTISLRPEVFVEMIRDICNSHKQHGFRDVVLFGEDGGSQEPLAEVAESLQASWTDSGAAAHFIAEYYSQDKWSYDFLKTIGVYQQPDVRSAWRAGIHDDFHYCAIMMTVDPKTVRMIERIAAGLFSVNGVDLNPPEDTIAKGRKLVEYRAELTVEAIQRSIAARPRT